MRDRPSVRPARQPGPSLRGPRATKVDDDAVNPTTVCDTITRLVIPYGLFGRVMGLVVKLAKKPEKKKQNRENTNGTVVTPRVGRCCRRAVRASRYHNNNDLLSAAALMKCVLNNRRNKNSFRSSDL